MQTSLFVRTALGRAAHRIARWIEAAAQRRAAKLLQRVAARRVPMRDDRLLADIGLKRGDVEAVFGQWSHLS
jgi:uncharacterized protein YjiS (DUF1127 family)